MGAHSEPRSQDRGSYDKGLHADATHWVGERGVGERRIGTGIDGTGPDRADREWALRTTAQRHGRSGAMIAALVGILSIGISVWALLAAAGHGLPEWVRAIALVGGVVAIAGLAAAAIITERLARH